MRRFALKSLLLALPFLLYELFILATDPYSFLRQQSLISQPVKLRTAARLNTPLWKLGQIRHRPVQRMLLGDSRMAGLTEERVERVTHQQYVNLAYGGGSLQESLDTFWYVARRNRLTDVYLGISLGLYNDNVTSARTKAALQIDSMPLLYFVNRSVAEAAFRGAAAQWLGVAPADDRPPMTPSEFWRFQLGPTTDALYGIYLPPVHYKAALREVADYCRTHHIRLAFVIPPTHVSLQRRVSDYHLDAANAQFRRDLEALGSVFDFDYESALTRDSSAFTDPYHLGTEQALTEMIRDIWLGDGRSVRVYESGGRETR